MPPDPLAVMAFAAANLAIGVVFVILFWRRMPADLAADSTRRRNARILTPVMVACWPSCLLIGALAQFHTGRIAVGWMFDVEPSEIWPGHDRG